MVTAEMQPAWVTVWPHSFTDACCRSQWLDVIGRDLRQSIAFEIRFRKKARPNLIFTELSWQLSIPRPRVAYQGVPTLASAPSAANKADPLYGGMAMQYSVLDDDLPRLTWRLFVLCSSLPQVTFVQPLCTVAP